MVWLDANAVGERIKKLREDRGLTQLELANQLGKKRVTVSAYESGRIEPPATVIFLLSTIFDVSADFLLGLNES